MNQNPFKVGDRVIRITKGNHKFMLGSEWTVKKIYGDEVCYTEGFSAHYSNFELVQSAEPKVKYPRFFMYGNRIMKQLSDTTFMILDNDSRAGKVLAFKDNLWLKKDHNMSFDVDFTIEPKIFDIDWWDARFNAGLPVWYVLDVTPIQATRLPSSYISVNKFFTKPMRYTSFGNPYIPWVESISCQDNVEANQQTKLTQKEQPMTVQQLLNKLFGASMPTDYDLRPQYLVVAYNRDGSEMGTATASTIKQVKDKVADTPELWGCKVLVYRLDKEVSVTEPVKATDAKVAEPA